MKKQEQFYFNQHAFERYREDVKTLCNQLNALNVEFKTMGFGEVTTQAGIEQVVIAPHNYLAECSLKNAGLNPDNFDLANAFSVIKKPAMYDAIMNFVSKHFSQRFLRGSGSLIYKNGEWIVCKEDEDKQQAAHWVYYKDEKHKSKVIAAQNIIDAINNYCAISGRFDSEEIENIRDVIQKGTGKFELNKQKATSLLQ